MYPRAALFALSLLALCFASGCERFGYDERAGRADRTAGGRGSYFDASTPDMDAGTGAAGGRSGSGGGAMGGTQASAGSAASIDASTSDAGNADADASSDEMPPASCSDAGLSLPAAPAGPLIHRYSFAPGGSTACGACYAATECAEDSVGGAHGLLHVATLTGDGAVQFTGDSWVDMSSTTPKVDQPSPEYVELPAHMLAGLTAVTFVVWYTWTGPIKGSFQHPHVFSFGSDSSTDPDDTDTFIYATPAANSSNLVRASIDNGVVDASKNNIGRWTVDLGTRSPGMYCLGVSFADATHTLAATLGSITSGSVTMNASSSSLVYELSAILDDHNYLGRSPIAVDAPFIGSILEFRIYNQVLDSATIATLCQDPETP